MQPAAAPPPPAPRPRRSPRTVLAVIALVVVAFLAGYVPQRMRADRQAETLATTTLERDLSMTHRHLGLAALEAQRGNHANAATAARAFFDGCATLAAHPGLAGEPRTRGALGAYAGSRDEIAVQLAQGDPQVAERLASLYLTMDGVLARRQ